MCQNRPLSMPPRSKNGSMISSHVSRTRSRRRQAGASLPAGEFPDEQQQRDDDHRRHDSRPTDAADAGRGKRPGDREATDVRALKAEHLDRPRRTGAVASMLECRQAPSRRPRLMSSAGQDRRSGCPDRRPCRRRRSPCRARSRPGSRLAGTPSSFAASRHRSSRLTLAISALVSSVGSNLPQRMSSVRNQRSWLWNG